jgi:excisionase family DNA binding protein
MELLTPEQVASTCRVTTQTVLNWVHAGKLEALRLSPRVIRIPREGFERFVAGDTHVLQPVPAVSRTRKEDAPGTLSDGFFALTPSLTQLARVQGVGAVDSLDQFDGAAWPPEEDVDDFLAAIRQARRR